MCNFCKFKTKWECAGRVIKAIDKARSETSKGVLDFDTNIVMALLEQGITDDLVYNNFLANKPDIIIAAFIEHMAWVANQADMMRNNPPKDLSEFEKLLKIHEDDEIVQHLLKKEIDSIR